MDCLFCSKKTQVTNSRKSGLSKIWRRRQCVSCKKSFTTQETPILENFLQVLSSNNKKPTPYNRAKLEISVLRACDHLINKQELHIQSLINTIENNLSSVLGANNTIDIDDLSNVAAKTINRLDKVAYLKYCTNHNIKPNPKAVNDLI